MNYKETLFFIGKCLTISNEKHNYFLVEEMLKKQQVDWDNVVKVSTAHFVFPALYLNLKRVKFLSYLPKELVDYMQHVTELNKNRNTQIICQAKEINELLLNHKITPTFIKGTGNLLEDLYDDISERMLGDIDFIVPKKEYNATILLLQKNGYAKVHQTSYDLPQFKHYPRLQKENRVAAVEIHKEFTREEFASEFNYQKTKPRLQTIHGVSVLSYTDQMSLSIIAHQLNDNGRFYKNISLRNAYDVYLLSKKANTLSVLKNFNHYKQDLINFLASCDLVLNTLLTIKYQENKQTTLYLSSFNSLLNDAAKRKKHYKKTKHQIIWNSRFSIIKKAFTSHQHRVWMLKRFFDIKWQNKKLLKLKSKLSS